MQPDAITVQTTINAPIKRVWSAYTRAEDMMQWNFASDDWHAPKATVDLRVGGRFSSRMEAKDGSAGFDFEGTYTAILPHSYIAYDFGDRQAEMRSAEQEEGVMASVRFDPETEYPLEQQREGWQAILDNFRRYTEATANEV